MIDKLKKHLFDFQNIAQKQLESF